MQIKVIDNIKSEDISNKFKHLNIDKKLKKSLKLMKMIEMTPIQAQCIPQLLEGNDLLGAAKTGSGKTLAFLVPLVDKVIKSGVNPSHGTVSIVLSPTRELSLQTFKVLEQLTASTNIRAGLIIGGNSRDDEVRYLSQGITILVATPGRLLDHLNNTKTFTYKNLHTLVIDEADRLMNQGFLDDMRAIIKKFPNTRQTLLFSATLNVKSAKLKKKMKKIDLNAEMTKLSAEEKVLTLACISLKENCVCVDMSTNDLPNNINKESDSCTVSQLIQNYVVCDPQDKFTLLCTILKANTQKKMIVFMSTCAEVQFYHTLLMFIKPSILPDVSLIALQGKQKQTKREANFEKFKDGKHAVLLCTDIAARGLDIPHIDLVIQYDPPEDHKEYIHRVGRTARAGLPGQAIIFLRAHENKFVSLLQKEKIPITGVEFAKKDILPIQDSLLGLIRSSPPLETLAKEAFKTLISAYISNPCKSFDVNQLDLRSLAATFGLSEAPQVHIGTRAKEATKTKGFKRSNAGTDDYDESYCTPPESKFRKKHH